MQDSCLIVYSLEGDKVTIHEGQPKSYQVSENEVWIVCSICGTPRLWSNAKEQELSKGIFLSGRNHPKPS